MGGGVPFLFCWGERTTLPPSSNWNVTINPLEFVQSSDCDSLDTAILSQLAKRSRSSMTYASIDHEKGCMCWEQTLIYA